jgi:hypothetical protein
MAKKCSGSKCKGATDCDDCVKKIALKKQRVRNAELLMKAKLMSKMPKQVQVDPFASYRNLPARQIALPPTKAQLTLGDVAREIELALLRRDAGRKKPEREREQVRAREPVERYMPTLTSQLVSQINLPLEEKRKEPSLTADIGTSMEDLVMNATKDDVEDEVFNELVEEPEVEEPEVEEPEVEEVGQASLSQTELNEPYVETEAGPSSLVDYKAEYVKTNPLIPLLPLGSAIIPYSEVKSYEPEEPLDPWISQSGRTSSAAQMGLDTMREFGFGRPETPSSLETSRAETFGLPFLGEITQGKKGGKKGERPAFLSGPSELSPIVSSGAESQNRPLKLEQAGPAPPRKRRTKSQKQADELLETQISLEKQPLITNVLPLEVNVNPPPVGKDEQGFTFLE